MSHRALLTDRERAILSGAANDVENPDEYRSHIKYRVKQRAAELETDLDLLRDVDASLAATVHDRVCSDVNPRVLRLEEEVARLQDRVEKKE